MKIGSGLAACGVLAVLAVTACGSSGSAGAGSTAPSWAKALGSGVTITAPAAPTAGQSSPGGVAAGLIQAVVAGKIADECPYFQTSEAKDCASAAASPSADTSTSTVQNFKLGYVATHGSQALVGTTGTFCSSDSKPKCFTNTDAAAVLSSGKTFAALWKGANSSGGNVYSLLPVVKDGGKWYAYSGQ